MLKVATKLNKFMRYYCTTTTYKQDSLKLYKHLLRQCQKLPKGPKEYYMHFIRQSYKQHINEADSNRISEIIRRSYEDSEWILKKYLNK